MRGCMAHDHIAAPQSEENDKKTEQKLRSTGNCSPPDELAGSFSSSSFRHCNILDQTSSSSFAFKESSSFYSASELSNNSSLQSENRSKHLLKNIPVRSANQFLFKSNQAHSAALQLIDLLQYPQCLPKLLKSPPKPQSSKNLLTRKISSICSLPIFGVQYRILVFHWLPSMT